MRTCKEVYALYQALTGKRAYFNLNRNIGRAENQRDARGCLTARALEARIKRNDSVRRWRLKHPTYNRNKMREYRGEGKSMPQLIKPVRDREEKWHLVNESVEVLDRRERADFDHRVMLKVRFADGHQGLVFEEELGQ